jgi:hypothetical protein
MRHSFLVTLVSSITACAVGPTPDPPLLQVTSPARSLIQDRAGSIVVSGTVAPNPTGAAISDVLVNGVRAEVRGGSFTATIDVPIGATLIHTVARDEAGGTATDTRSVLAGERRAPGSNIEGAVAASISATAFAKLANIATAAVKQANLTALIKPMNPVAHSGDEAGPDCLYAQGFVDSATIADAKITLVPVTGGLQVSATFAQPRITGHTLHAVACADGSSNFVITADSATLSGVLKLATDGMNGFAGEIAEPVVQMPGLDITATNFPDALLDVLPLERIVEAVAPLVVKSFVNPRLNEALGTLSGPQTIGAGEQTLTVQVAPRSIAFNAGGASALLDVKMLIAGAENAQGFTFTPNGTPDLASGGGLALGIADDLANDALAQLAATGLLNLNLKQEGADFNTAKVTATTPPVIAADGADGKLRVIVPDLMVTFLDRDVPVARAAVNAEIPIAVVPAGNGAIAVDLGTPGIAIDMLDDLAGFTLPPDSEFRRTITLAAGGQKASIADTLKSIPLPKLPGIELSDVSVGGDDGYVLAKTKIE